MIYAKVGTVTIAIEGSNLLILKGDIRSNEVLAEVQVTNVQSEAWREVLVSMEKKV